MPFRAYNQERDPPGQLRGATRASQRPTHSAASSNPGPARRLGASRSRGGLGTKRGHALPAALRSALPTAGVAHHQAPGSKRGSLSKASPGRQDQPRALQPEGCGRALQPEGCLRATPGTSPGAELCASCSKHSLQQAVLTDGREVLSVREPESRCHIGQDLVLF